MIVVSSSPFNMTLTFQNCIFYYHKALSYLISVLIASHLLCQIPTHNITCSFLTNVTFNACTFIGNNGGTLNINSAATLCRVNIYVIGPIYIYGNYHIRHTIFFNNTFVTIIGPLTIMHIETEYIMWIQSSHALLSGPITIAFSHGCYSILYIKYSHIVFNEQINLMSNACDEIITIYCKEKFAYIKVLEFSNIAFNNNKYNDLISIKIDAHGNNPYPFCFFQYMTGNNNSVVPPSHYSINITDNSFGNCKLSFPHLVSHCKWIPTAVYQGYNPGSVNQKIIQINHKKLNQHTTICHCSNCSIDNLGTIYPGQTLQIKLCKPCGSNNNISVLYVETHNAFLPPSACKLAHQSQLITSIIGLSKVVNFTIVSDAISSCEIFLTASPFLYEFYEAFSIQLMPCPIGFTQQNGVCDCDPILPNDINTCYIDELAIRHPATTWITAREQSNNREYLVSHCPMDYCLPYSSNINLLNPDVQCQFNRTGVLCSQCQHPLSMVFGSSRCMKCDNFHLLISVIILIAGVSLVILLYLLNLTVTNGTVNGIVLYANIISINDSIFLANENIFKPLRVFISFVNLDLGIETCFYNGMDSYAKVWLQLLFPTYLIAIAVFIIIASRYSTRMLRLTFSRSLPVLATLFLLAYTGILRVTLTVLFSYSTITYLSSGDKQLVWSIDASVSLFGLKFIILFVICLLLLLLLVIFNITLLFTRYLAYFKIIYRFKPLLDAFQGSYKDKYYNWVAINIILRCLFFILYIIQVKLRMILASMTLMLFTSYFGYIHPNKHKMLNTQEVLLLINLTIMHIVSHQGSDSMFLIVTNIMISLAFVQFCAIAIYHSLHMHITAIFCLK